MIKDFSEKYNSPSNYIHIEEEDIKDKVENKIAQNFSEINYLSNISLFKIFVGGLNYITLQDDLKCYFKTFGKVVKCIVILNDKGKSKGYGFVTFEDEGKKNIINFLNLLF